MRGYLGHGIEVIILDSSRGAESHGKFGREGKFPFQEGCVPREKGKKQQLVMDPGGEVSHVKSPRPDTLNGKS